MGKKNRVEATNYDGKKWINQTQLGNAFGHSNIVSRTQNYSSEYKKAGMQYKIVKVISLGECFKKKN